MSVLLESYSLGKDVDIRTVIPFSITMQDPALALLFKPREDARDKGQDCLFIYRC